LLHIDKDSINGATTVAEVQKERDKALQGMQVGETAAGKVPGVAKDLTRDEDKVRKQADARIAELNAAQAAGKPPPDHDADFDIGNGPWDPVKNPIHFDALPAFANKWLNQMGAQAKGNFARIKQNPILLVDAWLSAMPSTLFVMLPLFAVLLKVVYFFKRRLYMEHFIVALHSHAFLCLDLLLVLLLDGLEGVTPAAWMHGPIEFAKFILILWMPLYLLLMQKRVYAQGWIMTLLKYLAVGTVYSILLTFGVIATFAVKLVWL
ncbi:MAG TPA: hypothetical protein VK753_07305, partial [Xanthomonadaceae bacterium]|nr:hypothetical protein [Xanthomonadaceae bacterium]